MTTLRAEPYPIPAADVGPENPLPVFRGPDDDRDIRMEPSVPDEDRRYMGWATAWRALPHRMQDGYSRAKREQALESIVLENEVLRATFLPRLGGRLASLYHKPADRELLARNPVFQPANLALRNAWFSGGIEWNAGQVGHHYLTCAPVFAAQVAGPDGTPCLRIYEWDRVKGFAWQVDFWLPERSALLYARARIVNPHAHELAMYWWTNIAVEEREDVRVLVPAETALCNPYFKALDVVELPTMDGRDITYSTRTSHAYDFFSRIPDGRRRWVAALDAQGRGFFEASTDRLRGRKLFCWGMGRGGRRWQEFLSVPGHAYIEIQAGLARTQMESIPMPGQTEWTWTEAFGYLEADADAVHGADWQAAWRAAAAAVDDQVSRQALEEMDARLAAVTTRPADMELSRGSGWGALERIRRAQRGEEAGLPPELEFPPESMGADQEPWLALLETGALPERDPAAGPGALMTQPDWQAILEESLQTPAGRNWLAWWHLGNMRMEARDVQGAADAWTESLHSVPTAWAYRNLAASAERRGEPAAAVGLLRQALDTGPAVPAIAVELGQALTAERRFREVVELADSLPAEVREHERVVLLRLRAAVEIGELDGLDRVFEREFATIREGEVTLTDLWYLYHERRLCAEEGIAADDDLSARVRRDFPPPHPIDFRMSGA